jgi:hypothetical protein
VPSASFDGVDLVDVRLSRLDRLRPRPVRRDSPTSHPRNVIVIRQLNVSGPVAVFRVGHPLLTELVRGLFAQYRDHPLARRRFDEQGLKSPPGCLGVRFAIS